MTRPIDEVDKSLRWSRRLSFVPRWSVLPTIRQQNVAEHSFHVSRTVLWLLDRHTRGAEETFVLACLRLALTHDDEEAASGDAPSPHKTPKDPRKMTQEQIVVKVADLMEALAFLEEELTMGNRFNIEHVRDERYDQLERFWACFSVDLNQFGGRLSDHLRGYLSQIIPGNQYPHPVLEK